MLHELTTNVPNSIAGCLDVFLKRCSDISIIQNSRLNIEIVNTWRNRLVGDRDKPANERFTRTNITIKKEWELLPSGFLGPVQLMKRVRRRDRS